MCSTRHFWTQSLARLNGSNLVREMGRTDVVLEMDEVRQELDITFKVKENELRGIYGTGGLAGGGYLGLVYSFFNLFGIGERIAMELDGGAAQSNLLLNVVGHHFLGSPFTLALSAFHRYTNLNVANIVPDTQDMVGVFRRRSTGLGLSGSYPLTSRIQARAGVPVRAGRDYGRRVRHLYRKPVGGDALAGVRLRPGFGAGHAREQGRLRPDVVGPRAARQDRIGPGSLPVFQLQRRPLDLGPQLVRLPVPGRVGALRCDSPSRPTCATTPAPKWREGLHAAG